VDHAYLTLIIIMFATGAYITSQLQSSGGLRLLMDQIVGPAVLLLLILAHGRNERSLLLIRNVLLTVVAAQCVLAIVQARAESILFYEGAYENLYWFDPENFDRWMGTTEGPLVLSLAICVTAPLTLGLRRSWLRFVLLILSLVGVLITQSRTGALFMFLIILYAVLRARMVLWARLLTFVAVLVAGYVIATSALIQGLVSRLTYDTGSTDARLRALNFLYEHWSEFWLIGHGLTSSYELARNGGLQTSIESSYFMYVVDVGGLLATLYFGAQAFMVLRYAQQSRLAGATVGAMVGCGLQHTFSGVAGSNLCGTYIWCAVALVVAAATLHSTAVHGLTEPGAAEDVKPSARTAVVTGGRW
jgi:hypothetical protein